MSKATEGRHHQRCKDAVDRGDRRSEPEQRRKRCHHRLARRRVPALGPGTRPRARETAAYGSTRARTTTTAAAHYLKLSPVNWSPTSRRPPELGRQLTGRLRRTFTRPGAARSHRPHLQRHGDAGRASSSCRSGWRWRSTPATRRTSTPASPTPRSRTSSTT